MPCISMPDNNSFKLEIGNSMLNSRTSHSFHHGCVGHCAGPLGILGTLGKLGNTGNGSFDAELFDVILVMVRAPFGDTISSP